MSESLYVRLTGISDDLGRLILYVQPLERRLAFEHLANRLDAILEETIGLDVQAQKTPGATPEGPLAEEHSRPHCPHCDEVIAQLAVWIDEGKRSAIFFCASCQRAFGAQLITGKETHLDAL